MTESRQVLRRRELMQKKRLNDAGWTGPSTRPKGRHQPNWGSRRLEIFRIIDGKVHQLHATRGWKYA